MAKIKSEEEQYQEKASTILNCTPLTSSVLIEYIEGNKITQGHATRKREGWFCVDLMDNWEFKVKEEDLCNAKIYQIKEQ